MIPYTLTNESVTVVVDGRPHVVRKGDVQFNTLRDAIVKDDWDAIPGILKPGGALAQWIKSDDIGHDYHVAVEGRTISFNGEQLPSALQERIWKMADAGENPAAIFNFWARLQKNPSKRSVDQLFQFLVHKGIPIEPGGTFLAYKGVKDDMTDCHTGTIDNSPGKVVKVERNRVSDDPRETCHFGLHVGALQYASDFGPRTIICRVDPENVVCVPYDYSAQKMRVCEYEVVGHHVDDSSEKHPMPDTTYEVDTESDEDDTDEDADRENAPRLGAKAAASPGPTKPRFPTAKFNKLDARGLLKESAVDLRHYASKALKIVGASKLSGGKSALVKRILRVRRAGK